MTIPVQIDSNAWNFLFDHEIDLGRELPLQEFALYITREVQIEIDAIPDHGKDGSDKRPLKQYIQDNLYRNRIKTTATFGFAEANPRGGAAVYGGFGQGTFQSPRVRTWYGLERIRGFILGKSKKRSGLTGNQADAPVGASSFYSVVLSCDKKAGPIAVAAQNGGKVIFLSAALLEAKSLGDLVRSIAEH